jgi:hypothetical protein
MAASGYTPISVYHSVTPSATPTAGNLVSGELALNIADGRLFFKDTTNTVRQLASVSGVTGPGSAVDSQIALFNGTTGSVIKAATISGIVLATSGVLSAAVAGTDYARPNTASTWSANQSFNSGNFRLNGATSGAATLNAPAIAGTNTYSLPPDSSTLGYINIPYIADKTSSYQLATTDVGEVVGVGTGGSITIPNSVFSAGDAVLIFNNTSGNITITCSITTAYISGADADVATATLATRGVANILFISSTACVITGNVS